MDFLYDPRAVISVECISPEYLYGSRYISLDEVSSDWCVLSVKQTAKLSCMLPTRHHLEPSRKHAMRLPQLSTESDVIGDSDIGLLLDSAERVCAPIFRTNTSFLHETLSRFETDIKTERALITRSKSHCRQPILFVAHPSSRPCGFWWAGHFQMTDSASCRQHSSLNLRREYTWKSKLAGIMEQEW